MIKYKIIFGKPIFYSSVISTVFYRMQDVSLLFIGVSDGALDGFACTRMHPSGESESGGRGPKAAMP